IRVTQADATAEVVGDGFREDMHVRTINGGVGRAGDAGRRHVLHGDCLGAGGGVAAIVGGGPGALDGVLDLSAGGAVARQVLIGVAQADATAQVAGDGFREDMHVRTINGGVGRAGDAGRRHVLHGDGLGAGGGVAAIVRGRPGALDGVFDLAAGGAVAGQVLIRVAQADATAQVVGDGFR